MTGTLLNVATVLVGGTAGMLVGNRLPARIRQTVTHGLGLMTLVIGLQMALKTENILVVLGSLLVGAIVGEILRLEDRLTALAQQLERALSRRSSSAEGTTDASCQEGEESGRFARGLVMASLIFCVGPMTILGSIQDGLSGDIRLLSIKSMLDGFGSLALASSLGVGVLFASIVVLVYQGTLTLAAGWTQQILTDPMVNEMTATGGVVILGLGLVILDILRVRVASFLPAVFIAPLAVAVLARLT